MNPTLDIFISISYESEQKKFKNKLKAFNQDILYKIVQVIKSSNTFYNKEYYIFTHYQLLVQLHAYINNPPSTLGAFYQDTTKLYKWFSKLNDRFRTGYDIISHG
ncbi:hypothetical protein ACTFIU_000083 [Dictyostelium citrinum]